jgi:uncharacterized membrane protein YkvA (DUF1232 family)
LLLELVLGLLVLWLLALLAFWLLRPKGVSTGDTLRVVPDSLRLMRSLIADRAVPWDVRVILVGTLVWLISPIDLIPEFIPVLGPIDDLVVAVAALRYVRRRLGSAELRRRWPGTEAGFATLSRIIGTGAG